MNKSGARVSIINVGRFLKNIVMSGKASESGDGELDEAQFGVTDIIPSEDVSSPDRVTQIVVACDAGMGSSVIGAEMLRKQLKQAGLDINVRSGILDSIGDDAQVVITDKVLTRQAIRRQPGAVHFSLSGFLDEEAYQRLVQRLQSGHLPVGCELRLLPKVNHITVACDSGIGTSAIGAEMLRKEIKQAGMDIKVNNCKTNDLDEHTQVVVTHRALLGRAGKQAPNAVCIALTNFLDGESYGQILDQLRSGVVPISSQIRSLARIKQIVVACDSGMGSSAIGAAMLRKKVAQANLEIDVTNSTISQLNDLTQAVITHNDLILRAMKQAPNAVHFSLTSFLDNTLYDQVIEQLLSAARKRRTTTHSSAVNAPATARQAPMFALDIQDIQLGLSADSKDAAIRTAGKLLAQRGYVEPGYVDTMFEREKLVSTYLGDGIAVPHGTDEARELVKRTGIVFCQYPAGVPYGEEEHEKARLVIGIAAKDNDHLGVLTNLTRVLDNPETLQKLVDTDDACYVLELLSGCSSLK